MQVRAKDDATRWLWLSVPLFGGLYAAQGITGSMVQTALPTALRDSGMALDSLGLLYLLYLPWALKFLWAPAVDRFSVVRLGRRRFWLLVCQSGLVACFLAAAFTPPDTRLPALMAILLLIAVLASIQDIATDALAVEATASERRGFVSGAGVGGAYLGFLVGIGLWLPVYAAAGWATAMAVMAGCLAIATLPALFARRLDRTTPLSADRTPDTPRPSVLAGLRNPTLRSGLLFLVVYQAGLRLGIALLGPFLVDAGLSLTEIGWLKGTGGAIVGFMAAVAGGFVVRRVGPRWSLAGCALAQAAIYLLIALAAARGLGNGAVLVALMLALSAVTSLAFVALYTAMMGWCNPAQTGTDFALLQSADAIVAIVLAALAGLVSEHFGHAVNFSASAVLLVAGAGAALFVTRLSAKAPRPAPEVAPSPEAGLTLGGNG